MESLVLPEQHEQTQEVPRVALDVPVFVCWFNDKSENSARA